jgi:hypothetical protein
MKKYRISTVRASFIYLGINPMPPSQWLQTTKNPEILIADPSPEGELYEVKNCLCTTLIMYTQGEAELYGA